MITGGLIVVLFAVGMWGMIHKRNVIKKIIGLNICSGAVVILFLYWGAVAGSEPPILVAGIEDVVDPLPQALMLTAIVVGVCLTALAIALTYTLYRTYGTLDVRAIERPCQEGKTLD